MKKTIIIIAIVLMIIVLITLVFLSLSEFLHKTSVNNTALPGEEKQCINKGIIKDIEIIFVRPSFLSGEKETHIYIFESGVKEVVSYLSKKYKNNKIGDEVCRDDYNVFGELIN